MASHRITRKFGINSFRTDLKQDTEQSDEMLIMTHNVPLNYESIGKSLEEMKHVAASHNVTFDGWSASVPPRT
jgi:hypothetical protein